MEYGFYDLVNRIDKLYVTYRQRFIMAFDGKIVVPKKRGTNQDVYLDKHIFMGHLNHAYAVGVFAGSRSSKFVCFDVDLDDKDLVHRLIDEIERFGFPRDRIYVSTSGGKGYHVEIFFNDLMYTNLLLDFYNTIISRGGFDWHKVEFRPTAKQSIKLPLSVHHKTGNVCWYLDRETLEPIMDPGYILEIVQVDRDWAADLIRRSSSFSGEYLEVNGGKEDKYPEQEFETVRFEGDHFPQMTGPGMMHNLMVSIAVHERFDGKTQKEIEAEILAWAAQQPADFITNTQKEIEDDAAAIAAWVWSSKFKVASKDKPLTISKAEVDLIMAQRGGTRRKVLFLIMMFCKWRTVAHLSVQTMAKYTGAAPCGVVKAVNDLQEEEAITVHKSKSRHKKGGGFCSLPKGYTYKIPSDTGGKVMNVKFSFRAEDFARTYREVIKYFIPEEEWPKAFFKKELEELRDA